MGQMRKTSLAKAKATLVDVATPKRRRVLAEDEVLSSVGRFVEDFSEGEGSAVQDLIDAPTRRALARGIAAPLPSGLRWRGHTRS